jgi:hypothetical protein
MLSYEESDGALSAYLDAVRGSEAKHCPFPIEAYFETFETLVETLGRILGVLLPEVEIIFLYSPAARSEVVSVNGQPVVLHDQAVMQALQSLVYLEDQHASAVEVQGAVSGIFALRLLAVGREDEAMRYALEFNESLKRYPAREDDTERDVRFARIEAEDAFVLCHELVHFLLLDERVRPKIRLLGEGLIVRGAEILDAIENVSPEGFQASLEADLATLEERLVGTDLQVPPKIHADVKQAGAHRYLSNFEQQQIILNDPRQLEECICDAVAGATLAVAGDALSLGLPEALVASHSGLEHMLLLRYME